MTNDEAIIIVAKKLANLGYEVEADSVATEYEQISSDICTFNMSLEYGSNCATSFCGHILINGMIAPNQEYARRWLTIELTTNSFVEMLGL